ncbi:head GIN domain-containing protein [Mangrovibacterium lignilyticum]|uniref:head GIN domain-containing protein n=1 Tax=Mangrovibacterium lignilyticum TaxID=2668052 RepID=UPI0013D35F88|nr:head GIN domain-containing protein [Mangrovibacterium lignilyticum]
MKQMKTKMTGFLMMVFMLIGINQVKAENVTREVAAFSEISLRIDAKLYLAQGDKQSVEIVAKESTLDELITEVKDRELVIRLKSSSKIWKTFETGKVEIYITVPEVNAITVSGSGDIFNDGPIKSRILNLNVSGSGKIKLDDLVAERVTAMLSGSGNVYVDGDGNATDLSITISGSGGFKGADFEAEDVSVRISGSGGAEVHCNHSLKARIAGSGGVRYNGNPMIDQSIAGSGKVTEF